MPNPNDPACPEGFSYFSCDPRAEYTSFYGCCSHQACQAGGCPDSVATIPKTGPVPTTPACITITISVVAASRATISKSSAFKVLQANARESVPTTSSDTTSGATTSSQSFPMPTPDPSTSASTSINTSNSPWPTTSSSTLTTRNSSTSSSTVSVSPSPTHTPPVRPTTKTSTISLLHATSHPNHAQSNTTNTNQPHPGAIIGSAIGGTALAAVVASLIYVFCRKKFKARLKIKRGDNDDGRDHYHEDRMAFSQSGRNTEGFVRGHPDSPIVEHGGSFRFPRQSTATPVPHHWP